MLKPKKSSLIKVTVLSLLVSLFFPLVPAQAIGNFSPNFIISDAQMTDYQSMGLAAIQKFLEEKGSFLASFITEHIDGGKRTAAEIIFLAANNYKINPKFLLTTIQKEQSLVEDATPTQYQLDWAAGYGRCDDQSACSSDNMAVQKFKGFAKQLDYAAVSM
ncbi:hypothetical protein HY224_03630, partial [Candidatus Uhrbacteria bacterium]|nr:hypothetical protein [Candidatus Uhrbacteria bacterium]